MNIVWIIKFSWEVQISWVYNRELKVEITNWWSNYRLVILNRGLGFFPYLFLSPQSPIPDPQSPIIKTLIPNSKSPIGIVSPISNFHFQFCIIKELRTNSKVFATRPINELSDLWNFCVMPFAIHSGPCTGCPAICCLRRFLGRFLGRFLRQVA